MTIRLFAMISPVGGCSTPEERRHLTLRSLGPEVAVDGERRKSRSPHCRLVPGEALGTRLDVAPSTDIGEALVSEPDEVLGCLPGRSGVVAHDGVRDTVRDQAVERDDRDSELDERLEPCAFDVGGGDNHTEDALVCENGRICELLGRRLIGSAEQQATDSPPGMRRPRILAPPR
jgi:hypothetical protein